MSNAKLGLAAGLVLVLLVGEQNAHAADICQNAFNPNAANASAAIASGVLVPGAKIVIPVNFFYREVDTEVVFIGVYGGVAYAADPSAPQRLFVLTAELLNERGLKIDSLALPRMAPQVGRTCLPTVIAFIQNLVGRVGAGSMVKAIPDEIRIGWMAAFMSYNPLLLLDQTNTFQLAFADQALRTSGIGFHRSRQANDLLAHLRSGKIALIGANVDKSQVQIEVPGQPDKKISPKVFRPRRFGATAHAMLAVGVIENSEKAAVVLIDPASGELLLVGQDDLLRASELSGERAFIEAFLIDDPVVN